MIRRTYFHTSIIFLLCIVALITPFRAVPCLIICKSTIRATFNTCSSGVIFILWSWAYSCTAKIYRISIRKFIKKWAFSNACSSRLLGIIISCPNHRTHLNACSNLGICRMCKSIISIWANYHTTPGSIIWI